MLTQIRIVRTVFGWFTYKPKRVELETGPRSIGVIFTAICSIVATSSISAASW